jgi:hypothetical protein
MSRRNALHVGTVRRWHAAKSAPAPARIAVVWALLIGLIAIGSGGGANAALINLFKTTTTSPAPTIPTTTTAPSSTTSTTVATNGALTLKDTGLTRIRVIIDSQTAWAYFTMDGTQIKASKVVSTSGNLRITSMGPTISVADSGQAVIDFVLGIPSGASTGISMCKNYQGPTTVTLQRMTDGTKQIGSYLNNGTVANPPSGQCENQRNWQLARSSWIGPIRWPARNDPRPLVLTHYFPWFDPATLQQNYGDQPTGPADTSDPEVVAQAVDLAAQSGVDAFIVEYEGTAAYDNRIDYVYEAANARGGNFKVLMTLDLFILKQRQGLGADSVDTILSKMTQRAGNASQLKMNGQPVVFVYGANSVDPAVWQGALSRLAANTGLRPFVIADDPAIAPNGIYQFGTYGMKDQNALNTWAADKLYRYRIQPGIDGTNDAFWVAPAGPGFDERRLNRPNPYYVDRAGGIRYDQEWTAALSTLPDWVVVTTWNEYYEQSHVMPGTSTGTRALEQTGTWASQFHTTG